MMDKQGFFGAAAVLGLLTMGDSITSFAAPSVDGVFSPGEYGAATSVVGYNPLAPVGNFQAATSESNAVGYSIYLNDSGGVLYGLLRTNPVGGGSPVLLTFANLYFDLDRQTSAGSDLGFEIGNDHAFIPGGNGAFSPLLPEVVFARSADNSIFEFSIPNYDFTGPIAGLTYSPGLVFPDATNPIVTLRLSQSFGYSVAGGASYGDDRLGAFSVVDAPEPTSMALFGVGLVGVAAIRRRRGGRRSLTLS